MFKFSYFTQINPKTWKRHIPKGKKMLIRRKFFCAWMYEKNGRRWKFWAKLKCIVWLCQEPPSSCVSNVHSFIYFFHSLRCISFANIQRKWLNRCMCAKMKQTKKNTITLKGPAAPLAKSRLAAHWNCCFNGKIFSNEKFIVQWYISFIEFVFFLTFHDFQSTFFKSTLLKKVSLRRNQFYAF